MHKYLRTIGFSTYQKNKDIDQLLDQLEKEARKNCSFTGKDGTVLCELRAETAPGMGIVMVGELDPDGQFHRDYYFPYISAADITSKADCSIQRHTERETYAGLLDDSRVGISLIFYMANSMEYRQRIRKEKALQPLNASLCGLSVKGKILLPLQKSKKQAENSRQASHKRNTLLEAAKHGDEDAIETLTVEDMDLYSMISRRITKEDIYSIIETCFMPSGIECDQYSIIGEITGFELVTNRFTGRSVYNLTLNCNDMTFHTAINSHDLLGEPQIGRRFKGAVWMQGQVHFES